MERIGFGELPLYLMGCCQCKLHKIKLHSGEHNAHKLTCKEKNSTRVYYLSAELKRMVAMKRKHKTSKSSSYTIEFIKVVPAA